MNAGPYCRCPGCGECASSSELREVKKALSNAYAELSKQQPALIAVFDRDVWAAVNRWKETRT